MKYVSLAIRVTGMVLGCLCVLAMMLPARAADEVVKPFGYDFFAAPQAETAAPVLNVPADYRLGPRDRLRLRYWTPSLPETVLEEVVSDRGAVTVPGIGEINATGLTLAAFSARLGTRLKEQLKQPSYAVDIIEVRTITVLVTGAARKPGQYPMKATAGLFDVVLAAGGAVENGSLRRISLLRAGKVVAEMDVYRFLLTGTPEKPVSLQDQDTVFFPLTAARITVTGEVARPAIFECPGEIRVTGALELAGGLNAAAYPGLLKLLRVEDGQRVERTLDARALLKDVRHADNVLLRDGDVLTVTRISEQIHDRVTIHGAVEFNGDFALARTPTMKALLAAAKLRTGAYWERADVLRLLPDGTPVVIPVPMKQLLDGAADDVALQDQDQVMIYRTDEKVLPALAAVEGAVVHPASYRITDKMHISDLLFASGGLQRDAVSDVAHLYRHIGPNDVKLLRISPDRALRNDPDDNLALQAEDRLVLYRRSDIAFVPGKVSIVGEVQRPGEYRVYQGLTLYDLILLAGGATEQAGGLVEISTPAAGTVAKRLALNDVLQGDHRDDPVVAGMVVVVPALMRDRVTIRGCVEVPGPQPLKTAPTARALLAAAKVKPGAYRERADVLRTLADGTVMVLPLPLKALLDGKADDVVLQDQDELVVYETGEKAILPLAAVEGPVKHPASYHLTNGMKLTDLLFAAGGLSRDAAAEVAHLYRREANGEVSILRVTPAKAADDPAQNIALQDGDRLVIYPRTEVEPLPGKVNVVGEVRRPGEYALCRGLTLYDLLLMAGGPTDKVSSTVEVARPVEKDGKRGSEVQTLALTDVLTGAHRDDLLADGMLVSLPRAEDRSARTMTVELRGQVKRPGTYVLLSEGEPLGSLITRAGGLTTEGEPFGIALMRKKEKLLSGATQEQIKTVLEGMDKLLPPVDSGAGSAAGKTTEVLDAAVPSMNPLSQASRVEKILLVSPRRLVEMPSNTRIGFKLESRETYLARMQQVPLTDGDVIEVPRVSRVVQVLGAVQSPGPVNYEAGVPGVQYLDRAGGPAPDADLKRAVVIKLSGTVQPFAKTGAIDAGDVIVVASKYQIIQPPIQQRWGTTLVDLLGMALVIRGLN